MSEASSSSTLIADHATTDRKEPQAMGGAMSTSPLTSDGMAAIGAFFFAGDGPSHSEVSRALTAGGVSDDYVRPLDGKAGPNKQQRVLNGLNEAMRRGIGRKMLESILSALRVKMVVGFVEDT